MVELSEASVSARRDVPILTCGSVPLTTCMAGFAAWPEQRQRRTQGAEILGQDLVEHTTPH